MPDLSNQPHSQQSKSLSIGLSWIVIIASVAFLAWTANHPTDEATPESEGVISMEEANELAMLRIQSHFIIGLAQDNPVVALTSMGQLEAIAKTARGKAAIAIIHHFIDPKNGLKKGLASLEKIEVSNDKDKNLKTTLQSALENGINQEQRESFEKQIGWFSQLIPTSEAGESDKFGAEIRSDSVKKLAIYGGFLVTIVVAGISGLILLILFFVLKSNGTIKMKYDATQAPPLKKLFIEAFAIYIGIMALGHLLTPLIHPSISIISYAVSFILAVFWPKIRGCSWAQTCELIGWNRGRGFCREVGAGILGYLGIIVIATGGLILTFLLIAISNLIQGNASMPNGTDASHPIVGMLDSASSVWGKLSLLFFAAGLAPFLEETMFRGSLFRYLRHNWGFFLSSVVGGIIFAIIHPQGIFALPALSAMGIGFALLREWRDSLIASMTAHALNNGAIVCLLLMVIG